MTTESDEVVGMGRLGDPFVPRQRTKGLLRTQPNGTPTLQLNAPVHLPDTTKLYVVSLLSST